MAENKDELQLKITMDDGSIVSGFLNINKKAKETSDKVESGFTKGFGAIKDGLSEVAPQAVGVGNRLAAALSSPLGLVTASVVALGATIKGAFDLTLEGEKLNKIDKQFDALANTFGVAGDALKTKFIDSLGGLVDDSDAVQSLNKAFVTLGDKVTQLPQIMDLARKATNLFGGDITSNFEAINQAIATGATRQLRGLGIIIDAEKAYKAYAKSIGTTVDVLSESGKQQAILNEVLAKGGARFKDVSAETGGLTSAYTRFKISLNNANEDIAKSFAQSGGFLEKFFTSLDLIVKKISGDPQTKLEDLQNKISETKFRIFELQDALSKRQSQSGLDSFLQPFKDGEGVLANVRNNLTGAQAKLTEFNAQLAQVTAKSAQLPSGAASKDLNKGSIELEKNQEKQKKDEKELTDFLFQENQKRINSKIQQNALLLNENISASQKIALLDQNFNSQDQIREEQKNQQILAIRQKYALQNQTDSIFEKQSLAAINESFFQQQLLAEQERNAKLKGLQDQANFDTLTGFQQVSDGFTLMTIGFSEAATSFSNSTVSAFKEVGKQAFNTLSRGVGTAFAAFGNALAKGEDAGKAFLDSTLKLFGELAVNIGSYFIALGVAKLFATPKEQAEGPPLIAAGAALAVLGGLLGGIGGASASKDTGGGISSSPSTTSELTPTSQLENQKPNTQVQVIIQGDVLDSDESGSRIVDLINQAFDKKGVTVQQGAFA